ncbi:MAG: acyl-CoA dehydrogenase family protein [Dehalococcoidia bacterium]|nr:acyl-CoA dehydrogenase family protein [Dehalococcoidia bacterium]
MDFSTVTDPLARAKALAPEIIATADTTERERRVPLPLVRKMADAGLFSITVPKEFGGMEAEYLPYFDTIEEVSRADGSTGWVLMIGLATAWFISGYLEPSVARQIFADPSIITAGAFPPRGRALRVPGGYRVTGRWPFGSGCQHASWFMGGCVVTDGQHTLRDADGKAILRTLVIPSSQFEVIDTWNTIGLAGTGSHDVAVTDVFVADEFTWSNDQERACQPGPLYAVRGAAWLGQAAHAVGVARRALDEFVLMAGGPKSFATGEQLRDRGTVQIMLAQAEAAVRSARAYTREIAAEVWDTVCAGREVTPHQRAVMRLSFTDAVNRSARAVTDIYTLCGMGSIVAGAPIDRAFRDLNVATHHAAVGLHTYEAAGRVMLGLESGVPLY